MRLPELAWLLVLVLPVRFTLRRRRVTERCSEQWAIAFDRRPQLSGDSDPEPPLPTALRAQESLASEHQDVPS